MRSRPYLEAWLFLMNGGSQDGRPEVATGELGTAPSLGEVTALILDPLEEDEKCALEFCFPKFNGRNGKPIPSYRITVDLSIASRAPPKTGCGVRACTSP